MCSYIDFFGYPISSYGAMVAIGLLACIIYAWLEMRKRSEIKDYAVILSALWIALGIFVGSHVLYAITNIGKIIKLFQNASLYFADFLTGVSLFLTLIGGMVFYGGLIGGAIALLIYLKKTKNDVAAYCDFYVPCISLFHVFGRIGCFLSGCCYGIEFPIGFTYTNSMAPEADGVCRLPLPLIEAFLNLVIFAVLLFCYNKRKMAKGHMILVYCFTYPIVRFVDEFFRGDEIRGFLGPFSTSQWISLCLFTAALVYVIVAKLRGKKIFNHEQAQ